MKTQSRASAATKLISIVAYFVITLLCEPLRCSAANPIKPIANTGMTIPVDGGKKFTSFGKEPSQDAAHQGDVAFTAIGAINQPPQPPGSAAAVIIYSDFLQAFVNPPVGETDKTVSGFKFASFDDRISFDHSLVAFRGVLQSNPKASGVFSWSSPGVITAVSPASYSRTVGLSQINTISATGFSPSFDNGTELGNTTLVPDLFWAYYYFNGTVTNDANHDTVHTAQDANDLYVEKNSMVRIKQLSSDFSSVRLHADGGNVAMYGGPGVSVLVGGTPNTVADASTPDPSAQLQPFTSFSPNTSDASPAFQKGRIAFHGANRSSGQLGIYFEDLGDMTKISPANTPLIVADKSSPIPDGGVNFDGTPKRFTTFEKQTCIDGSLIAFVGGRANPPGSPTPYDTKGIYVSQISSTGQPGAPVKVVDLTTKLDFGDTTGTGDTTPKAPMDLSIGHEALVGNKIVFWAEYDATHSGIFIAEVDNTSTPQPIVTVEPAGDGAWNTSTPAAFRIERTGSIAAPLTVTFTHTGGTADSANYDVAPQIDSVRFNPGDTSKLVTITPHNTSITDAQTVLLTITGGGTSYQIGSPASAVVTIFPDAPPPSDAWLLFGNDNITSTSFLGSKAGNLNPVVIKIGGDEKIRIDTAGKLSIGTSASKGSMDVNGRASMTGFRLNKLPDGQTGFVNGYVLTSQDDQGNGAWSGTAAISITGNAASATTAKDFLNSLDGDVTGTQTHTVVSSFGGKHAADFWQLGGNDTSMSKMQNKLFLGTSDLDNSPLSIVTHGIERMHIDADPDGNVGIGTPNPHAKLEIKSGFDTEVLRFGHSDGDYHSISTSFHGSTPAFNYLGFNLESNTSDIRRVLTLRGDGTVGIGTDNPDSALEIDEGNLHIRGASGRIYFEDGPTDPYYYLAAYKTATAAGMRLKGYAEVRLATGGPDGHDVLNVIGDKVGIGTDNPDSALEIKGGNLHIRGASGRIYFENGPTDPYYYLAAYQTATAAGMRLKGYAEVRLATGGPDGPDVLNVIGDKVGIGTGSPQGSLHIYSPDNPTTLRIQSSRGFGSGKLEFWSDPQGSQYEWRPAAIRSTDNGNFTGGLSFVVNGNGWGNRTGEIEVMRLVNGSVGIGTSHPEEKLEVNGSMKVHGDIICDGTIFAKPPSKPSDKHPGYHGLYEDTNPSFGEDHYGMWHWPSDQRLKRAVSTIPNALAILKQLRGVNFLWNDTALEYFTRNIEKNVKSVSGKPDDNKRIWEDERKAAYASLSKQEMGFVAQEVEKVFPNWVSTDTQGYKRINMARLNAVMVNAIKEQQDEIEAQQKEISELKAAHNRAAANWEARLKKLEETVASNKPK